eukprot:scaffold977_cov253-Pinguiococcus_pyrenoidosus.AAC.21
MRASCRPCAFSPLYTSSGAGEDSPGSCAPFLCGLLPPVSSPSLPFKRRTPAPHDAAAPSRRSTRLCARRLRVTYHFA